MFAKNISHKNHICIAHEISGVINHAGTLSKILETNYYLKRIPGYTWTLRKKQVQPVSKTYQQIKSGQCLHNYMLIG